LTPACSVPVAAEVIGSLPVDASATVEDGPGTGTRLIARVGAIGAAAETSLDSGVTTAAAGLPEAALGENPAASDQQIIPTTTTLTLAVIPSHKMSPASLGRRSTTVEAAQVRRINPLSRRCLQSANTASLIKFNQRWWQISMANFGHRPRPASVGLDD